MTLYVTPGQFVLQSLHLGKASQLVLERATGRCFCTSQFNPLRHGTAASQLQFIETFGLLGIVPLGEAHFLVMATEAEVVGTLGGCNVYEIRSVELLQFEDVTTARFTSQIRELKKLLASGFYFSYHFDLTNPLEKASSGNLHERANTRFYWNLNMYQDLIAQNIDSQWFIPIIQGYVGLLQCNDRAQTVRLGLISRRSCERTGTRYNCRGVDDDGNVANFVETEQILEVGDWQFAYVQVRGSVPVYWTQSGVTAQLEVTRSSEQSYDAFVKHIPQLVSDYSHFTIVNLLSSHKTHERMLTDLWEDLIKQFHRHKPNQFAYRYFDFHEACRGQRFDRLNNLVSSLDGMLNHYAFFAECAGSVEHRQNGVFRTNCLDCLDRTNVAQSYVAWKVLTMQLQCAGIQCTQRLDESSPSLLGQQFRHLWAENADKISIQYTGAASTISGVTRVGTQGFSGFISQTLRSFNRFYSANMEDSTRQQCIDTLLRRNSRGGLVNRIEQEVLLREHEYAAYQQVSVHVVTWNLNGPITVSGFVHYLEDEDIIVLAAQQLTELSGVSASDTLASMIEAHFEQASKKYCLVAQSQLHNTALLIYAKTQLSSYIRNIQICDLPVQFKGKVSNKGAALVRFDVCHTSVCVANCHLTSGTNQSEARKQQLLQVLNTGLDGQVLKHDLVFLCGNLNFRVALNNSTVRELITQRNFSELLRGDQLRQTLKTHHQLRDFQEAPVEFPPTYKFDVGRHSYDSSDKPRVPAWCGRILYRGSDIDSLAYGSATTELSSDHRPVYAVFRVKVKEIDFEKRNEIYQEISGT